MATQFAKIKDDPPQTLWSLAETDNVHQLESVLSHCPDINEKNAHGTTPLMLAAANGRLRMVRALLAHGADPNLSRNDNFTPLLLAAFFGHEQIVKLLVEYGADTNAATRFGTSAQMWASSRTFAEVVAYLNNKHIVVDRNSIHIEQKRSIDVLRNVEPSQPSTQNVVKQPAPQFGLDTQNEEYVPTLWVRIRELLHRNVAVYPLATLIVVAVVIVGLSIRQKLLSGQVTSQKQQRPLLLVNQSTIPSGAESASVRSNVFSSMAPAAPNIPAVAPKTDKVSSSSDSSPGSSDSSKANQKSKPRTEVRVVAASDFAPLTEPIPNNTQPPPTPSTNPTDVQKSEATAVKTTTVKPQATAPDASTAKKSTPLTSDLITPAKSSAPKGKVIQWP